MSDATGAARRLPDAAWPIARVLVPLDGSAASEEALPYAADIARRTGARITLAHVREPADVAERTPDAYPAPLLDDPLLGGGLDVEATVLHGTVRDALLAHADATRADLIVMTSSGRAGFQRAVFGSVADAVVRQADIPVLVVKPRDDVPPFADVRPHDPPVRRVLLPLDGTAGAERIIPYALALTGTAGVHYLLLRVHPAFTPDGRLAPRPILGAGPDPEDPYLSTIGARIADQGVLVSARAPTHASDADVIVRVVAEEDVDLVALTTRGAGGVERMIFGSVADEVLRRAPCHVLVLRPPPADEPAAPLAG